MERVRKVFFDPLVSYTQTLSFDCPLQSSFYIICALLAAGLFFSSPKTFLNMQSLTPLSLGWDKGTDSSHPTDPPRRLRASVQP
jgi:hypothetical protein